MGCQGVLNKCIISAEINTVVKLGQYLTENDESNLQQPGKVNVSELDNVAEVVQPLSTEESEGGRDDRKAAASYQSAPAQS